MESFFVFLFGLKLLKYNFSSDYIVLSFTLEEKMLGKEESRKLLTLLNEGDQLPFDDIIVNFTSSFPRSRVYAVCSSLAILLSEAELPSKASSFWMSKLFFVIYFFLRCFSHSLLVIGLSITELFEFKNETINIYLKYL